MQPSPLDQPVTPKSTTSKVVVQHNALVNARFDLSTVEMRLFMAMLSRIGRDDNEFQEMRIPLTEVVALSGRRPSVKDYQQVAGMCDQLVSRILHIERPVSGRRRERRGGGSATPDFDKIPLMAYAKYRGEEGALRVRFNDEVMPYLLQLHQNFTKAQVVQLLKLKSPHSYRVYWLLKEYAAFGARTLGVEELKSILSLEGQYRQFPLFRLRVLDRAKEELAQTDIPFEYELLREGKSVTQIKFTFKPLPLLAENSVSDTLTDLPTWQRQLQELGLAERSLATVCELVAQGKVSSEYVQYVVRAQRSKFESGKLKSLPGAVFSAIAKQHLLADFEAAQRPKTRMVTAGASSGLTARQVREREKILGQLEDAQGTLHFVRTGPFYTDTTRPEAEARVLEQIAVLETRLQQLGG